MDPSDDKRERVKGPQQQQDDTTHLTNGTGNGTHTEMRKEDHISITVLGNISSGKTTLTQQLANVMTPSKLISEPVEIWQKNGLLGEFYTDIDKKNPERGVNRRAVLFQNFAFVSRLVLCKAVERGPPQHIIQDSHVLADRYCFVRNLHEEEKLISDIEFEWYNEMFGMWQILCPTAVPDIFIYLRSDPQVCFDRNLIRQKISRPEESSITLSYLQALHNYYEDLIKMDDIKNRLVIVDGNKEEDVVLKECLDILKARENIKIKQ